MRNGALVTFFSGFVIIPDTPFFVFVFLLETFVLFWVLGIGYQALPFPSYNLSLLFVYAPSLCLFLRVVGAPGSFVCN